MRVMIARSVAIMLGVLMLAGCAIPERKERVSDPSAAAPGPNETIIVQGIGHPQYHVTIHAGEIENGVFKETGNVSAMSGRPIDGYLIGRIESNTKIAVTSVMKARDKNMPSNAVYPLCNSEVFVFDALPGRVVYLGDIQISDFPSKPEFRFEYNLADAQRYVDKTFIQLKGKLEPMNYRKYKLECRKPWGNMVIIYR